MKALVRGTEVLPETEWNGWVRNNLAYMTGTETVEETDVEGNVTVRTLPGDGWTLVEDYQEPDDTEEVSEDVQEENMVTEASEDTSGGTSETVTYQGKEYTLDDLKKLIGEQ